MTQVDSGAEKAKHKQKSFAQFPVLIKDFTHCGTTASWVSSPMSQHF